MKLNHKNTSIVKSLIRIAGYVFISFEISILFYPMMMLIVAELIGILEEFADKRVEPK